MLKMGKKGNKAKFFYTNLCFFLFIDTLVIIKSCDQNTYEKHLANHLSNEQIMYSIFSNFEYFEQLILECNQTYHNITPDVVFFPNKEMIIDNSFDLRKILDNVELNSIKLFYIRQIKGVDLNSMIVKLRQPTLLYIYLSKLNIYSNHKLTVTKDCNSNVYTNKTNTFLNSFEKVFFTNTMYPSEWCPFFFLNSNLVQIIFRDITNSFINKNRLRFYELDENAQNVAINSLANLQFTMHYETLDNKILNKHLFKNVIEINLFGVVNSIEIGLFKDFPNLKSLDINVNNLKVLMHQDLAWLTYLNEKIKVDLNNLKQVKAYLNQSLRLRFQYMKNAVSFDPIYEYPDEDICNFKTFPHDHLVMPVLVPGRILECTCTLYWLQMYSHLYVTKIESDFDYSINYKAEPLSFINKTFLFCDSDFDLSKCDLKTRFSKCNKTTTFLKPFNRFRNDLGIFYLIKWLQFILLIILHPCLCLMGLVNNILTIVVIRNRSKRKEFDQSMYKHIQINALFNIIYCLIMPFKLINTCIYFGSGIFCSRLYQMESIQYFKIIFIQYLGNVIRICSNFTYVVFSLSRLFLITIHKDRITSRRKSSRLVFIIYIFGLLAFSSLFSLFKLFQYRVNIFLDTRRDFPLEIRDEFYCSNMSHSFECRLFNTFKIANRSLNDILFVFLNVLIDLILIRKFRQHLNNKLDQIADSNQHKLIEKSKKNLNRMILYNSLMYVLSHLPEFVFTILLIVYSGQILNFCNFYLSCDLINEEAEFFGLISIVGQFYIFKFFDKNFSASLNDLKRECVASLRKKDENESVIITTLELRNLRALIGDGRID